MSEVFFILFALWCAFLNRAAGSKLYGKTDSTQLGRIVFAVGVAVPWGVLTNSWLFPLLAIALWFWRWKGWGDFFAAIHGRKSEWRTTGDAPWAVWLSDKIWNIDPKEGMETKLKATLDMSIRMSLIIPAVIISGNYLHALAFPLLGIAYFISGLFGEKNAGKRAEYACGVIIAAMLWGW